MPPRSAKMKRRILGFQRRVWWPKWTPASSSSRMETAPAAPPAARFSRRASVASPPTLPAPVETAMGVLLPIRLSYRAGGSRGAPPATRGTRATAEPPGSGNRDAGRLAAARRFQRCGEVRRERRRDVDRLARDRVLERESRRVEELPLEAQVAWDAVERIAGDGKIDCGEMHT